MKKLLGMACLAVPLLLTGMTSYADDLKVGVVSALQVFETVPEGRAKIDGLKAGLQPEINKLQATQQAILADAKAFERDAAAMDEASRKAKQEELQSRQQAFQKRFVELRNEEVQKEQLAAKDFERTLSNTVSDLAKEEKLDVVISDQMALYFKHKFDITEKVIARMKK